MMHDAARQNTLPLIAAITLLLLGVTGAAFYGWIRFGSAIILALGESGLSWCL